VPRPTAASATAGAVVLLVLAVAATSGSGAPSERPGAPGGGESGASGPRTPGTPPPRGAGGSAGADSYGAGASAGSAARAASPAGAGRATGSGYSASLPSLPRGGSLRLDPTGPFFTAAGKEVRRLRPVHPGPKVALIFDDGPGPQTPEVLHELRRARARATFFLIGREVVRSPALVRLVRDAGMELGNHSFSHTAMNVLDARTQRAEVTSTATEIWRASGVRPALFRPPDIAWNDETARAVSSAGELGVLHTVETLDWARPSPERIARAAEVADAGDIVALHDAGGDRSQTVAAIAPIVRALRRRGLECVTVSELLGRPAPGAPPSGFADLERRLGVPPG
jgi:peptidoglycan/xylan/chitin deacetylase (PgdA/CDA1 family)